MYHAVTIRTQNSEILQFGGNLCIGFGKKYLMMNFAKPTPYVTIYSLEIEIADFASELSSSVQYLLFLVIYDLSVPFTLNVFYKLQTAFSDRQINQINTRKTNPELARGFICW